LEIEMSEERQRSRATRAFVWGFVLLMLYVASVGPVVKFYGRGVPDWVFNAYAPIAWLHDHTPLEKPLDAYIRLWAPGFNSN
jgi:hypothetical protein